MIDYQQEPPKNSTTFRLLWIFSPACLVICPKPFHAWETGIYIVVLSLPILLIIYLITRRWAAHYQIPNWTPDIVALVVTYGSLFLIVALLFTVNVVFDKSPPKPQHFIIEDAGPDYFAKHLQYLAYFLNPVPSPLPFAFSKYQSVHIYYSDYPSIVPGKSGIDINMHHGFLGFPYYSTNSIFVKVTN